MFVGRDSLDLVLPELSLAECRAFWGEADSRISAREKFDLLSVTGGVPKYLEDMDPSLSAEENVRNLCFLPEGSLFRDFDETFADVFGPSAAEKKRLLRALSEGSATTSELARKAGYDANGHLSAAPYRNARKAGGRGVQIDLLLQSSRSACIVEIKRKREIGREVIAETNAKVHALRLAGDKSIRTALVYEGHLHPGVEADGFFDRIVPAEVLFES